MALVVVIVAIAGGAADIGLSLRHGARPWRQNPDGNLSDRHRSRRRLVLTLVGQGWPLRDRLRTTSVYLGKTVPHRRLCDTVGSQIEAGYLPLGTASGVLGRVG
jgi:hypothetical protein